MPTLHFDLPEADKFIKDFEEELTKDKRFAPAYITIDAPYVEYVEFGTGPANKKGSDGTAYKNIRDWVEKKKLSIYGESVDEVAGKIYHKIMEEGSLPHPFIMPAMYDFFSSNEFDTWFDDEKHSVFEMATRLAEMMKNNLDNPQQPFEHRSSTTNILRDSIEVHPATNEEYDEARAVDWAEYDRRSKEAMDRLATYKPYVPKRNRK